MKAIRHRNVLWGIGQFVLTGIIMGISIRTFLDFRGPHEYGVFSILMLANLLSMIGGLGLNTALVKFLAEQGKVPQSDTDIVMGILLPVVIAVPLIAVGWHFSEWILLDVLGIPPDMRRPAEIVFVFFLFSNLPALVGQIFCAMLDSLENTYLTSILQVMNTMLFWALILTVVLTHLPFEYFGAAGVISAALFCIASGAVAFRAWGRFSPDLSIPMIQASAKKQLTYGMTLYSGGLIALLHEPLTKVLISRFVGVQEVGIWDIGIRVKNLVWGAFSKGLYPLYPFLAKESRSDKISFVVQDLERKLLLITVPIACIMFLVARPLVEVWIGRFEDITAITIATLSISYLFGSTLVTPFYLYLMARGYPSTTTMLQLVNVLGNGLFIFVGYPYLGFWSAVIGSAVALFSSFVISLFLQERLLGTSLLRPMGETLVILATGACCLTAGAAVRRFLPPFASICAVATLTILITIAIYRFAGLVTGKISSCISLHILKLDQS